ncbi:hypothetical protein C8R43DRAFT_1121574 [Mycena crocata]|nr:hypothetical protein C8R43DRAFT_1121574 [Mycena crocata]
MPTPRPSAYASRNPMKPTQPSRKRKRAGKGDAAQKSSQVNATEALERKILYEDSLDGFWEHRTTEIVRIAKTCHKSEREVRKMLANKSRYKTTCRPNLKNTLMHDRSLKAKASGLILEPKDLQRELEQEIDDDNCANFAEWADGNLDDDERKRLIDQLIQHRETQSRGVRLTEKAAQNDAFQTVRAIGEEAMDLYERTGTRIVGFVSRGHPDDPGRPSTIESDDALVFFKQQYGIDFCDMLRHFELWCLSRDEGEKDLNDANSLRREVARLILDLLRKFKNNRRLMMSYIHYDIEIRERLKVELAGWPVNVPMTRPAKMSVEVARRIRDMLRTGAIHWVSLTKSQHEDLVKKLDRKRAKAPNGQLKPRNTRSDKGVPRGPRKSGKEVEEEDEGDEEEDDGDEEEDEGDEEEEEEERMDVDAEDDTDDSNVGGEDAWAATVAAYASGPTPLTSTPAFVGANTTTDGFATNAPAPSYTTEYAAANNAMANGRAFTFPSYTTEYAAANNAMANGRAFTFPTHTPAPAPAFPSMFPTASNAAADAIEGSFAAGSGLDGLGLPIGSWPGGETPEIDLLGLLPPYDEAQSRAGYDALAASLARSTLEDADAIPRASAAAAPAPSTMMGMGGFTSVFAVATNTAAAVASMDGNAALKRKRPLGSSGGQNKGPTSAPRKSSKHPKSAKHPSGPKVPRKERSDKGTKRGPRTA